MRAQHLVTRVIVSLLLVQAMVPATRADGQEASPAAVAGTATPIVASSAAATGAPAASAVPMAARGPALWLRGPFGRVAGGQPDDPAAAPPGDQPLDTVVRRAPLVLEAKNGVDVTKFVVYAQPLDPAGVAEPLSDGALMFDGPDGVGRQLIVAQVSTATGAVSQLAWLVDVPDQQPPADGLYDIPAPEIVVTSSRASAAGRSGSGCYAYLCVDVGNPPPTEGLPVLAAGVGETLLAEPADGSAITAWDGRLSSLGDPARDPVRAEGSLSEPLANAVRLTGLEPPAPGRWLLNLMVEFDRERGWMRTFSVLDVE